MNEYKIAITNQANLDLRSIFDYIAFSLQSPKNATVQLTRIEKSIRKLKTFPEIHPLYAKEPWRSHNLRVLHVDNYCVFFIADNNNLVVTIIRIIYSGRDMDAQLTKSSFLAEETQTYTTQNS